MPTIVTILTDFGLSHQACVGMMKGVILGIAPDVTLVDLTHDIAPHDVLGAAVVLESAVRCFPPGTVHLAVVDPGVGSERSAIAVQGRAGTLVGPDNGIFTPLLEGDTVVRAVRLDNAEFHRQPVSATFHGRDIFAPAAAHLALGTPLGRLGTDVTRFTMLDMPRPIERGEELEIHLLSTDRFGNLLTDLTQEHFERWHAARGADEREDATSSGDVVLHIRAGVAVHGLAQTYTDVDSGDLLMYFGSSGRLEIGVREGSAHASLKIGPGDVVHLRHQPA